MGYRKLYNTCCGYFCERGSCPQEWKLDWREVDLGPGYEDAERKWRFAFRHGPLVGDPCMCRWWTSPYVVAPAFSLERSFQDGSQLHVIYGMHFLWPELGAHATWDMGDEAYGFGPCDGTFTMGNLVDFGSLDGLFSPPPSVSVSPWLVDD